MCGIVGYIGKEPCLEMLLQGLEKLEYRGYDSAGVALIINRQIETRRAVGRLSELREKVAKENSLQQAVTGIGHTRWATHGGPTEANAHPHCSENIALVHNGIVENYQEIRKDLESRGYKFASETDTEVAVHLLNHLITANNTDYLKSLSQLMDKVEGSFAFVAIDQKSPDTLLIARHASPMVIGVGEQVTYIASDVTALLEYTRKVIYLEDGDYAVLKPGETKIYNQGREVGRKTSEITWDLAEAQKGGFAHFMIKEIYDQPKAVNDTLSGRLVSSHKNFQLPEVADLLKNIKDLHRIKMVACGTAWHACILGKYFFEQISRTPADVEIASEFRYQNPILLENDLFIALSQSGETADTLAAVDAVNKICPAIAVTNVLGSSLSRKVDATLLTQAGPEISVASTKAFTTQALLLYLLAIKIAYLKEEISPETLEWHLSEVTHLASQINEVLKLEVAIKEIALKYNHYEDYFFLGRGSMYPIALEGALKLKEITYYAAEGYPAGELKHGPLALISSEVVTIALVQSEEPFYSKTLSNLNEIKSRSGKIITISDKDSPELQSVSDEVIIVPHQNHYLVPILATVPVQFFAYHVANTLGRDIDKPRNLAKSVTVE